MWSFFPSIFSPLFLVAFRTHFRVRICYYFTQTTNSSCFLRPPLHTCIRTLFMQTVLSTFISSRVSDFSLRNPFCTMPSSAFLLLYCLFNTLLTSCVPLYLLHATFYFCFFVKIYRWIENYRPKGCNSDRCTVSGQIIVSILSQYITVYQ